MLIDSTCRRGYFKENGCSLLMYFKNKEARAIGSEVLRSHAGVAVRSILFNTMEMLSAAVSLGYLVLNSIGMINGSMGFHLGHNILLMVTLWQTNTAGWKMDPLEIYFLFNMGIFQPAHISLPFVPQLVFSDVSYQACDTLRFLLAHC